MTLTLLLRMTALLIVSSLVLAACGEDDVNEDPTLTTLEPTHAAELAATATAQAAASTDGNQPGSTEEPAGQQPDMTAAPDQSQGSTRLSPEELQQYQPNELGWIPVLQYHYFGPVPDDLTRTPEQFRNDLQWLYDNNFYVINIRDYLQHEINVPAGKRPVMLTFDDSSVNQFSIIKTADGQLTVDPDCAIAIMEAFFTAHPDFGRGGHFAILPDSAFSWPDAWDQQEFAGMKLQWLIDNGYELGNHTLDHENLALVDIATVQYQLAEAEILTRKYIPDARLEIVTLPYGGYPAEGDDTVFSGFIYEGEQFTYDAVLLVGANPAFSPVSTEYHPYWIPRIQAFDEELGRWQEFILENPGIMYVSDGNPDTVTIPANLEWNLLDTLDQSKLQGRELIRY